MVIPCRRHVPYCIIRTADDLLPLVRSMHGRDREIVRAFFVTRRGRLIRWVTIDRGSEHRAVLHPRVLFRPAILADAAGIFLVHNHPSEDDPVPSPRDIEVTQRIARAGTELLCIEIHDHLILGRVGYVSFKERGLL